MSVKISTLYSQVSALARQQTVQLISDRLERLYLAALRQPFTQADGQQISKFVYLDMEEYRDMALTAAVFMRTLGQPGMEQVRAGIALQAYVPDSYAVQQQLTHWARQRVQAGGAAITIRIVKGANMEMERVVASQHGWPQAPYRHKVETDANYKRMVRYGLRPQNIAAAQLGIASHNLFDVAFAFVLAAKCQALPHVQFEMLEGMANHQRRALHELVDNLLLYAPACKREDFIHAIGYLVRRMDENTGPDNFLRHAFKIEIDSPEWQKMERIFFDSLQQIDRVTAAPRRTQNRTLPAVQPDPATHWKLLVNEADTDFCLPHNSTWAESIVDRWSTRCDRQASEIPLAVAGEDVRGEGPCVQSRDPSRPGVISARYQQASQRQIEWATRSASTDPSGWRTLPPEERYRVLRQVAQELRDRRADLMGAAMADGGKTISESDPEVSEAIDFVEFYALTALQLQTSPAGKSRPRGMVVVISPWNFPIAIPCGGIAAALAAGNTVVLKPASDTALPARILCECFWAAGVSRHALQLLLCSGADTGRYLLSAAAVEGVILTGGTETAQQILAARPALHLLAETGGKNATIVSSLSDRELAIKHVLHSAFSHSGQKCSATSLLLLEREVYYDSGFRESLVDAVESLVVGSAWELTTKMGPLIRPPSGVLQRGLTELEPGEAWAVKPRQLQDNPCLYSPGVKWDVPAGGFTHSTELFGPLLGVMPYRHLNEAIERVHQTGYGLTSGLETLDDREQQLWSRRLQAGNLYINRPTTGAVVLRQPFGGMGKSAFGPGIKAGGPNYLVPLMRHAALNSPRDTAHSGQDLTARAPALEPLSVFWQQLHVAHSPAAQSLRQALSEGQWQQLLAIILDYDKFAVSEIRASHDTLRLIGQDNLRRYLPMTHVRIRLAASDQCLDIVARAVAVVAAGGRATVSHPPGVQEAVVEALEKLTQEWAGDMEFVVESDTELEQAIERKQVDRLRYASPQAVPLSVRQAAARQFVYIADEPVCPLGRVELLWYVREQSLCMDYHRYGNLGFRAGESRQPTQ
ncbi:MAG: bifunctional proline dehydrogenase/L-glutamate gamma-semialdehyde dehydrogenase [Planctomycetales bacterium]|nr:bifunctional proline dehydrogenase/L-glutamate gamma-semialdehyde dehydrogenase [Planctomycetales bacterium]